MILRRLMPTMMAALFALAPGLVQAQGAFPAPLPNQSTPAGPSPFPPVNGSPAAVVGAPSAFPTAGAPPVGGMARPAPGPQAGAPDDRCMKEFMVLRTEAEKRGNAIKAAGERHAPPDEACKLIASFAQSELKMIKYVDVNAQKCGIPPQISEQMRGGHKNTDQMQKKVCAVAQQQQQRGPAGPSLSEVLGSSTAMPEASATGRRGGGSTFDTLNGNVLAR